MSNRARNRGLAIGLGLGLGLLVLAAGEGWARGGRTLPPGVVPPPLSWARAKYFDDHPAAWADFVARLPRQDASAGAGQAATPRKKGPWQTVTAAPASGLCNPLLLTDGSVLVHSCSTADWYRLIPDAKGNYADGTWSPTAALPTIGGVQYAPQYNASAVLPDGRAIVVGGEYNNGGEAFTSLGAIYDPVADQWTAVTAPRGKSWKQIGDAESVVLANGSFMLGACCGDPDVDAILDPATLTWTSTGAPAAGASYQDEQGYELLPNGNVLTIDVWTHYGTQGNATNTEQYSPLTATWTPGSDTPVSLPDPYACGTFEIGPAVLRGDGTLVAFGGNTGCVAGATNDPTAILDTKTGAWTAGPDLPAVCGTGGTTSCTLADAPAALEPTGTILFASSSGFGQRPTHFFEYSAANTVTQVADTVLHAGASGSYYYNFLVLPNGQIFSTDLSNIPEIYTPAGAPVAAWAPVVTHVPTTLTRGTTYLVRGRQLNGRSQGAYYGDDAQDSTNYPIVKVVNTATGDVAYARSFDFSQMSIAPQARNGSASFVLPAGAETGASSLYVVANGIASKPVSVTVN